MAERMPEETGDISSEVSLILWEVACESFVVVAGRKKGERFIRLMAAKFARIESMARISELRPGPRRSAARLAQSQAVALFATRYLPLFLASLPPE